MFVLISFKSIHVLVKIAADFNENENNLKYLKLKSQQMSGKKNSQN